MLCNAFFYKIDTHPPLVPPTTVTVHICNVFFLEIGHPPPCLCLAALVTTMLINMRVNRNSHFSILVYGYLSRKLSKVQHFGHLIAVDKIATSPGASIGVKCTSSVMSMMFSMRLSFVSLNVRCRIIKLFSFVSFTSK